LERPFSLGLEVGRSALGPRSFRHRGHDIALDPSTVDYGPFGPNVASIEIWRLKDGDIEYKPLRSIVASASGQSHFQDQWTPAADDIGKNTLVALVATNVLPLLDIEAGRTLSKR
jgi:hypothetical protein